ncbi:MAG: hypothetical protein WD906_06320 [Anaerolineales bacterium]
MSPSAVGRISLVFAISFAACSANLAATESAAMELAPSSPTAEVIVSTEEALETERETETPAPEPFRMPEGRVLYSADNPSDETDYYDSYFVLNLPDLTVEPYPRLEGPIQDRALSFSPDMQYLAFERNASPRHESEFLLLGPDSDEPVTIIQGVQAGRMAWSRDQRIITFWIGGPDESPSLYSEMGLYDVRTRGLTRIPLRVGTFQAPLLSPDNQSIVFENYVNFASDPEGLVPGIYLMTALGGDLTLLVESDGLGGLFWSADGSQLYYRHTVPRAWGPENHSYVLDLASKIVTEITLNGQPVDIVGYLPDGETMSYFSRGRLYLIPKEGEPVPVPCGACLGGFWLDHNRYLIYMDYGYSVGTMFLLDMVSGESIPLTEELERPLLEAWLP